MINKALQFTKEILDQFFRNRFSLDESKVLLNKIVDSDGSTPQLNQNKVVLSLINVEKETNKQFYNRNKRITNGNFSEIQPFERYNLDILLTSNFDDYGETLKFLNASILFFQIHQAVDSTAYSNIPVGLNKLEYDIEKITYHQMHSLWTAMGAKYQPSVIYKLRLVTVQGNEMTGGFTLAANAIANSVLG